MTNFFDKENKKNISDLLYLLYKISKNSDYAVIANFILLFDYKDIITLLNYYQGETIKIPKKYELYNLIDALLLYNNIDSNYKDLDEAITLITKKSDIAKKSIIKTFNQFVIIKQSEENERELFEESKEQILTNRIKDKLNKQLEIYNNKLTNDVIKLNNNNNRVKNKIYLVSDLINSLGEDLKNSIGE